jgi:hypothetical protein
LVEEKEEDILPSTSEHRKSVAVLSTQNNAIDPNQIPANIMSCEQLPPNPVIPNGYGSISCRSSEEPPASDAQLQHQQPPPEDLDDLTRWLVPKVYHAESVVAPRHHHHHGPSSSMRYQVVGMWLTIASILFLGSMLYLPWFNNPASPGGAGGGGVDTTATVTGGLLIPLLGHSSPKQKSKAGTTKKHGHDLAPKYEAKSSKAHAKKEKSLSKHDKDSKHASKDKTSHHQGAKTEVAPTKAAPPPPSAYPWCLEVNITHVKTPLSWADHEIAARAKGCHLASVHSVLENTKLATTALFQLTPGTEIAAHFMSGAVLARDYYLGGYVNSTTGDWAWTDQSVWDYGFNDTSTAAPAVVVIVDGCLQASIDFVELGKPEISYLDHWKLAMDCTTPLPAIYKCCILPAPTLAPSEVPTEAPTVPPTDPPTLAWTNTPTLTPTDSPTLTPTDRPTRTPTDSPTRTPTDSPTQTPTDSPTLRPTTVAPTKRPTMSPTKIPTRPPTYRPTSGSPTPLPTARRTKSPTDSPRMDPKEDGTTVTEPTIATHVRHRMGKKTTKSPV